MNLYLAEITYNKRLYEGPVFEGLTMTHLVKADDEEQARDKVYAYMHDKTSEYSVYYSVTSVIISGVIE